MAILDALINMYCWKFCVKFKSFNICKKESEDEPKIPRALIERLTKLILVYSVWNKNNNKNNNNYNFNNTDINRERPPSLKVLLMRVLS